VPFQLFSNADLGRRGLVRAAGYSWQRTGAATRELLGRLG
jgi:hypothetical protein